jgi:hypothetical protein
LIVERTLVRKDAPDRVVIFTSVVGQFRRNVAAPGAYTMARINGVCPKLSWAFGSAPSYSRSSTKLRFGTLIAPHA